MNYISLISLHVVVHCVECVFVFVHANILALFMIALYLCMHGGDTNTIIIMAASH